MWKWIKDHWWLLLIGVGIIALILISLFAPSGVKAQLDGLKKQLELEKEVINEKAKVRVLVAETNHATAAAQIKKDYAEKLEKMDEDAKKEISSLEHDPEALVERMLRVS